MKFHHHYKISYQIDEGLKIIRDHVWITTYIQNLPVDIDKSLNSMYKEFIKEI